MKNRILLMLLIFSYTAVYAQESLYEDFKESFTKKYLKVGTMIKFIGDFQQERTSDFNGFQLRNVRLKLSGDFDYGIGYYIQTEFTRSPAILDARISYNLSEKFALDAGLFKSPFSHEFLTSSSKIDFVDRAQVTSLASNRQIGVMARGSILDKRVSYMAGMFNGNRAALSGNDNNDMLYGARVAGNLAFTDVEQFEVGINGAVSRDSKVSILGSNFDGKRTIYGADFRFVSGPVMLSGEAAGGQFESGGTTAKPFGYQVSAGYSFSIHQVLLRWDSFKLDTNLDPEELVILGYNVWPTKITKFQVNYIVDTSQSEFKYNKLLFNAQLAFN